MNLIDPRVRLPTPTSTNYTLVNKILFLLVSGFLYVTIRPYFAKLTLQEIHIYHLSQSQYEKIKIRK